MNANPQKRVSTSTQLDLPLALTEHDLQQRLQRESGCHVRLILTDNSRALMSFRKSPRGEVTLRLHRMFLHADAPELMELARFIKTGRGQTPLFWEFVRANRHRIRPAHKRPLALNAEGTHHDLTALFEQLNKEYFGGRLQCRVTWGRKRGSGKRVRTRTLGSYSPEDDLIRLHPMLDSLRVPQYYVRYVLYHEMLHALMLTYRDKQEHDGPPAKRARRRVHDRKFQEEERLFKEFERARRWERRNL